ncbi:MAG TPA: peptide deformylase, partial [bacterium]|nr:peptide deformylase [bacterium]
LLPPQDPSGLAALLDLRDTMERHPGCVGLAAPQIGHRVRAIVVDVSRSARPCENHGLLRLLNPEILEASQWKASREGCLSFPDLLANVKRAQKIRLRAFNERWEEVELACVGFEAVALQHEIDHLDGILFLDRIRSSKDLFERRKATV